LDLFYKFLKEVIGVEKRSAGLGENGLFGLLYNKLLSLERLFAFIIFIEDLMP